jgi:hypothetical protein
LNKEIKFDHDGPSVKIENVYFTNVYDESVTDIRTGEAINIHVFYESNALVEDVIVEIWLYGMDGIEYASFTTAWSGISSMLVDGRGQIVLKINELCLMSGSYFVQVAIADKGGLNKYDMHWDLHRLIVLSGPSTHGLLYQPHQWITDVSLDS